MKQCAHIRRDGSFCSESAHAGQNYCVLHAPMPENPKDPVHLEWKREKKLAIDEKIARGEMEFPGVVLPELDLSGRHLTGPLNFTDARILGNIYFEMAHVQGDVIFKDAAIGGKVYFEEAEIQGDLDFSGAALKGEAHLYAAHISGHCDFSRSILNQNAVFRTAVISGQVILDRAYVKQNANLDGITIGKSVSFEDARIEGNLSLIGARIAKGLTLNGASIMKHGYFDNAEIGLQAELYHMDIRGELTFYKAVFKIPRSEETACGRAKLALESLGNRDGADYHFYREMDAKRRQKKQPMRTMEYWFVQMLFGYGVYWKGIFISWLFMVVFCGLVYWIGNGVAGRILGSRASLWESVYFSVVTVTTIGYGDFFPRPGFFQFFAGFQALAGTFMWAALIATFARKYMR